MNIPVGNRLGKTKEYYFSKKLREIAEMNEDDPKVINLGIGSPDQAPHPEVIDALENYARKENVHGYQAYNGIKELRNAFAEWYKRYFSVSLNPDKEVLPLLGSKEGIMHLCMTFLNEGDEVLVPDPGYPTYSSASKLAGATCITYNLKEENDWKPDLDQIAERDLSRVKIMWVNYPHMPTGSKPTFELFESMVAFTKKHEILLVHDNPYAFVLPGGDSDKPQPLSIHSVPGSKEVAVELNSLSKSHNMAGWRIGVLTANEEIVKNVLRFKSNMDSGSLLPLQQAAVKALSLGNDWFKEINKTYAEREKAAKKLLDLINCSYQEPQQGMFLWAKVPSEYKDGYELSDRFLYKARVFITPGGIFGKNGEKYVRISLCSSVETLQEAIERITKVLKQEKQL